MATQSPKVAKYPIHRVISGHSGEQELPGHVKFDQHEQTVSTVGSGRLPTRLMIGRWCSVSVHWRERRVSRNDQNGTSQDCGDGGNDGFLRRCGVLHKLVEGHHLKNNHGASYSHKKRAAPVDSWPISNNIPWGTPCKNTGNFNQGSLCWEHTTAKASRAGAHYCQGFTCVRR